jgi:membrane carboxypeptidase/penicillin-binding protein PbpC
VIDLRVAWLISDILSDNLARVPAFGAHSILQIGRPAAVKTGTTSDYRDNWTVGYTPNLVVGAWVGNANNEPMVSITGVSGAGPIWHHFMRTALRGQPELAFERPEDMIRVEVCSLSGLLPTPDCPYTRLEWFIPGTAPTDYDTFYKRVVIDNATGLPADDSTPPERRRETVFLDLPPQAHEWARKQGLPLLPDSFAAVAQHGMGELIIASPDAYTIYRISAMLPPEGQKLRLVALGPPGLHDVTIILDNIPLATIAAPPFETWWVLQVGEHTVTATGYTAQGELITSGTVPFTVKPPE